MRKGILVAILGIATAAAGLGYRSWNAGTPVEAVAVRRGPIQEYVDEEGKTRLAETYQITMPFDARIEPIALVEGTVVKKGQTVAQVWRRDLELQKESATAEVDRLKASIRENDDVTVENTALKQTVSMVESIDKMVEAASARVKSSQARLEYAEKNLARIQRLAATNTRTEDDLDQARVQQVENSVSYQTDVLALRASEAGQTAASLLPTMVRQYIQRKVLSHNVLAQQLEAAEVRLREVEKNEKLATMTSPVDGVVLERLVSDERPVASGTVLLRIGTWDDLELEADVLSQDVVRIKPGQRADVQGAAVGNGAVRAEVTRIFPAGFTKTSSLGVEQQRVKVIARFAPGELKRLREQYDLGVGYRVRMRFFTAEASGTPVIPRSALFRSPKNDWRVFVVRGGRAQLQTVEVGLSNDDVVEVTKGLSENDQVIVAPESSLTDGQAVQVIETEGA